MIDPHAYIRASILAQTATEDLRRPDVDETPLSPHEVAIGINTGAVPAGPIATRIVDVYVFQRQRVQVFNIPEAA